MTPYEAGYLRVMKVAGLVKQSESKNPNLGLWGKGGGGKGLKSSARANPISTGKKKPGY